MPLLKKYILLIGLVCMVGGAWAQASFSVSVSDKNIGKSDILQVAYIVTDAEEANHFSPPFFNDWHIVMGPDYNQQDRIINNHRERKLSYIYSLAPKRAGELEVPATTVIADGKKLFCKALKINVSSKNNIVATPSPPPVSLPSLLDGFKKDQVKQTGTPEETINENIFIKVSTSNTSCFVGEPVLVTYQLFSALRSQSKVSKQPAFSGCSVVEMTTDEPSITQEINGKKYRVFLIRKVQLIPLQPGHLVLDTAIVESEVSFSTPDNPYQVQTYTGIARSKPQTIEVKSLPATNKPVSFSGAIGKFQINAKVDSLHIPAGENNNLRITIEGEGNMEGIAPPGVNWPAGTEHFEGKDSQYIDKMSFPEKGSVLWDIPFIATREGTINLPGINFSYFDPTTGTYHTITTENITISAGAALEKTDRYKHIVHEDITNRKYLWIIPGIALTVIFVWIITVKKKKPNTRRETAQNQSEGDVAPTMKMQAKPVEKFIPQTDFTEQLKLLQNIINPQEFFTHVKAILTAALQEKLQTGSASQAELLAILKEQSKDNALIGTAANIFKISNLSLYSPVVEDDLKESVYEQLKELLERLG